LGFDTRLLLGLGRAVAEEARELLDAAADDLGREEAGRYRPDLPQGLAEPTGLLRDARQDAGNIVFSDEAYGQFRNLCDLTRLPWGSARSSPPPSCGSGCTLVQAVFSLPGRSTHQGHSDF
jgi:hypothetical protein